MDENRKWHLAWSQLDALKKNFPDHPEESTVAEFHAALKLLHEATGEDISPFQIPDQELKPRVVSFSFATRRRPGSASYSKKKYCDRDLMMRKIEAAYGYFTRLLPPQEQPPEKKYGY